MKIIINQSSMIPIYEQMIEQIKALIIQGELAANDALPSVRALSKELKISALTVKKAYDILEEEGLTKTIHGKGTFVCTVPKHMIKEERRREIESDLEKAVQKGRSYGLSEDELNELFHLIMEA